MLDALLSFQTLDALSQLGMLSQLCGLSLQTLDTLSQHRGLRLQALGTLNQLHSQLLRKPLRVAQEGGIMKTLFTHVMI